MRMISLKCPNCQGELKVNEELETATCNYCGSIIKLEDENETKEERIIKAQGRQKQKEKESERKYYASDDYKKKLEIENETNDKSLITKIGKRIDKERAYYNSSEYKERLKIQEEERKKSMKIALPILIFCCIAMIGIPIIVDITDDGVDQRTLTCTLNDKEYILELSSKDGLSCASCSDEMLSELNEKYFNQDKVALSRKNIKTYFTNNGGEC